MKHIEENQAVRPEPTVRTSPPERRTDPPFQPEADALQAQAETASVRTVELKGLARMVLVFVTFLFFAPAFLNTEEESHPVIWLEIKGTIDPALTRYVMRGLEEARQSQASAVILELDTPGGLDSSMRTIVQGILNSSVPVVVYVSPSGARAASAGVFIAEAAHVAAMAPNTNIGLSVLDKKPNTDAAATLRSIAELHDQGVDWIEKLVSESRLYSADQALEMKTIDFIAANREDLCAQLEDRQVKTVLGAATLRVKGQPIRVIAPSFLENVLHHLARPNVAYILFLAGFYGLIYELAIPGYVLPAVLGAISLILSLAALEMLGANWAGLFLIVLSLGLFIADIKLPGYGALMIGGFIAFLCGSVFLFPGERIPHMQLPWGTMSIASGVTVLFFVFVIGAGIRALKRKVTAGMDGLTGEKGIARTDLKPDGIVHVKGEKWHARAVGYDPLIKKGSPIKVVRLEGLTVHVEPVFPTVDDGSS